MKRCHKCGAEWRSEKRQPGVKEFCSACTAYLHCCKNCRFHDPNAHNQCRIPTTEWVGDRAGANFCDEFEFADRDEATAEDQEHNRARATLERLLGGDEAPRRRPKTLDDLFGN